MSETVEKESGRPVGPAPGILLALLVLAGLLMFDRPFQSNRPPTPADTPLHANRANELHSRLWRDPFEALSERLQSDRRQQIVDATLRVAAGGRPTAPVATAEETTTATDAGSNDPAVGEQDPGERARTAASFDPAQWQREVLAAERTHTRSCQDAPRQSELFVRTPEGDTWTLERKAAPLLLMPVLVHGGTRVEETETRRRIRYAIVSALATQGYAPERTDELRWLEMPWPGEDEPAQASFDTDTFYVPYEVFARDPVAAAIASPAAIGNSSRGLPASVVVAWIDENRLFTLHERPRGLASKSPTWPLAASDPLQRLEHIVRYVLHCRFVHVAHEVGGEAREQFDRFWDLTDVRVIGPASSTTLIALAQPPIGTSLRRIDPEARIGGRLLLEILDLSLRPRLSQAVRASLLSKVTAIIDPDAVGETAQAVDGEEKSASETTPPPAGRPNGKPVESDLPERWTNGVADLLKDPQIPTPFLGGRQREAWEQAVVAAWRGAMEDLFAQNAPARLRLGMIRRNLEIISPRATAPDRLLNQWITDPRKRVEEAGFGDSLAVRSFARTIPADDALVRVLVDELIRRRIRLPHERSPHQIVLISEWDTHYGRALPFAFKAELLRRSRFPGDEVKRGFDEVVSNMLRGDDRFVLPQPPVHQFYYLRGLDGQGATQRETQSAGRASSPRFLNLLREPTEGLDLAAGDAQVDGLRRLAERLRLLEADLRREGQFPVRAIGVFGSDHYDKRLVFRAVREVFPGALIFTTDLDARMLDATERGWSQNLLVASGFGLQLRDELQGGTPPFRDGYQSATYLAALMAVAGHLRTDVLSSSGTDNGDAIHKIPPDDLEHYLLPRLFEVGRHGAVDITKPGGRFRLAAKPSGLPAAEVNWLAFLHLFNLVLAAVLILVISPFLRRQARAVGTSSAIVILGGAAAIFALFWYFMLGEVDRGGEPFTVLSGISVWPTKLIQLAATLLGAVLLWRCRRGLEENSRQTEEIYLRRFLEAEEEQTPRKTPGKPAHEFWRTRLLILWRRVRRYSIDHWYRSNQDAEARAATPARHVSALRIWRRYRLLGRTGPRVARIAAATSVFTLLCVVLFGIFGLPTMPVRGQVAFLVSAAIGILALAVLSALTFFVVDATRLCEQFIHALAAGPTLWPPTERLRSLARARGLPPEALHDFVDVVVIARRTATVGPLVIYPFAVMALLILSRTKLFDAWTWPPSLIIILGILFLLPVTNAIQLRRAAEHCRERSLRRLNEALSRERGRESTEGIQTPAQIELLIAEVRSVDTGAFGPWTRNPLVQAMAWPFGGAGAVALLDVLAIVGW